MKNGFKVVTLLFVLMFISACGKDIDENIVDETVNVESTKTKGVDEKIAIQEPVKEIALTQTDSLIKNTIQCSGDVNNFYKCLLKNTLNKNSSTGTIQMLDGIPKNEITISIGENIIFDNIIGDLAQKCVFSGERETYFIGILKKWSLGQFGTKDLDISECSFSGTMGDYNIDTQQVDLKETPNLEDLALKSENTLVFKMCDGTSETRSIDSKTTDQIEQLNKNMVVKDNENVYSLSGYGSMEENGVECFTNVGEYKQIDLEDIRNMEIEENFDIDTFIYVGDTLFKDKYRIYKKSFSELESLEIHENISIDVPTFEYVGNNYFKDKNYVYRRSFSELFKSQDFDVNSFRIDENGRAVDKNS